MNPDLALLLLLTTKLIYVGITGEILLHNFKTSLDDWLWTGILHVGMRNIFLFVFSVACMSCSVTAGYCQQNLAGRGTLEPEFRDGVWNYVDQEGKSIIRDPRIEIPGPFSQGLAPVKMNEKWVYVGIDGQPKWNKRFDSAHPFREGFAAVKVGAHWGYINRSGNFSIQPQFQAAADFSEGLAAVKKGTKWGYTDSKGILVIAASFADAEGFSEGLAATQDQSKWGYIRRNGSLAIPRVFESAQPFSQGLAAIEFEDRWGYINTVGKVVVAPKYEYAEPYSDGLASVTLPADKGGGDSQYIFPSGDKAFEETFKSASTFSGGFATVEDLWGNLHIINRQGKNVGQPRLRPKLSVKLLSKPPGAKVFMVPLYDWERWKPNPIQYFLSNRRRLDPWRVQDGLTNIETVAAQQKYMVIFLRKQKKTELKDVIRADVMTTKKVNQVMGVLE